MKITRILVGNVTWLGTKVQCIGNALYVIIIEGYERSLFVKSTGMPMHVWMCTVLMISSNQLKTGKKTVLPVKDAKGSNTAIKFKGIYSVGSANSF